MPGSRSCPLSECAGRPHPLPAGGKKVLRSGKVVEKPAAVSAGTFDLMAARDGPLAKAEMAFIHLVGRNRGKEIHVDGLIFPGPSMPLAEFP